MKENVALPDIDLTGFVRVNINFLHVLGYFYPEFHKGSIKKLLYIVYATSFVSFTFILTVLTQSLCMIQAFGKIEEMSEASYLLFANVIQCFKMSCFLRYGPRIWKLVHSMNRELFKPRNKVQYNILKEKMKMAEFNSKLFLFGCTLTCTIWGVSPMIDDEKDDVGIRLPFKGWYPFDTDKSPNFELIYIYQIFSTWVCGLADLGMDTFMSAVIMYISAQLSVLNDAFETMRKNTQTRAQQKLNAELLRNINHHKNILEVSQEVTFLFTNGITAQFIVGGIVICVSMFQLSLTPIVSFQFMGLVLYQGCAFAEAFLLCFYGNEIVLESDRLTQSAYMCEWIDASVEFKQNLIIFLARTQISLRLYASGYFILSLDTFKAIAKSAWSYFAVLTQVHDQKLE